MITSVWRLQLLCVNEIQTFLPVPTLIAIPHLHFTPFYFYFILFLIFYDHFTLQIVSDVHDIRLLNEYIYICVCVCARACVCVDDITMYHFHDYASFILPYDDITVTLCITWSRFGKGLQGTSRVLESPGKKSLGRCCQNVWPPLIMLLTVCRAADRLQASFCHDTERKSVWPWQLQIWWPVVRPISQHSRTFNAVSPRLYAIYLLTSLLIYVVFLNRYMCQDVIKHARLKEWYSQIIIKYPVSEQQGQYRHTFSVSGQFSLVISSLEDKCFVLSFYCILASDFALLRLLTWWCHGQFAPPSVNGLSSQQLLLRGMLCLVLSILQHQCYSLEVDSRQKTIRVFIPAILLNLSLRHCDSTFLFRDLEVFGFTSR